MEIDIAALAEAVVGEKMKVPAIIEQGWSLVQLYAWFTCFYSQSN